MKLVQNLPEIFEEFGEKKREAFLEIKEYKDKGIPVIGMYCACLLYTSPSPRDS